MKEHAKKALKHDINVAGKTIPTLAVAALFLVGTGSAALLTSFGTVQGEATIDQAVHFDDGDTVKASSFNNTEVTAGTTETTQFTLHNDADREAEVQLDSSASNIEGIQQTVKRATYQEQSYALDQGGDEGSTVVGETLYAYAEPSDDTVTYSVELPSDYFEADPANINFEISPTGSDSEDNYQVSYYPADHGGNSWTWRYANNSANKDVTESGSESEVEENADEVVNVDFDDSGDHAVVTVEVKRYDSMKQSFMIHASDGGESYDAFHTPKYEGYNAESTEYHQNVGLYDVVTETPMTDGQETVTQVTLQPDGETDFKVTTDFHVALDPSPTEVDSNPETGEVLDEYFEEDSYVVDLGVVPGSATE